MLFAGDVVVVAGVAVAPAAVSRWTGA